MKDEFELWLDENRQKLLDWYCEGTMVDKDFLTRIEEFAKQAYNEGYRVGVFDCTPDWG